MREIVKAYRQAGEALAAAHEAGLVHRDFKPENAIMGTDGRVRVVDFGLACEATDPDRPHTLQRAGAGTPKYMAPEQVVGGEITAAADQYGFCTALGEALKECPGGTPRWLQAVIDRGAAPYPTDRFPSMTELLKALARDPARVRQRWFAGAALAAAGVAAFVAGRSTLTARADACRGGEARIAEVWGSGGREAALARLAGLGDYGRSVQPRLETQLQDHQTRWAAGYRNACLAHQQGVQSGALLDRRMACLERDRAAMTSMAELVQTADASALPGLVLAARALPDPAACEDLDSLLTNVEPPATAIAPRVAEIRERLAGARVQLSAGRYRQARAIAEQAVAETRTLGYAPLLAEALLLAGHATMATDERIAAATPLDRGIHVGVPGGRSDAGGGGVGAARMGARSIGRGKRIVVGPGCRRGSGRAPIGIPFRACSALQQRRLGRGRARATRSRPRGVRARRARGRESLRSWSGRAARNPPQPRHDHRRSRPTRPVARASGRRKCQGAG